jgi:hypothetical protein
MLLVSLEKLDVEPDQLARWRSGHAGAALEELAVKTRKRKEGCL